MSGELKLAIIMPLTQYIAASNNSYMYYHGQEEGEDPVLDRFDQQKAEAEKQLYEAIQAHIDAGCNRARVEAYELAKVEINKRSRYLSKEYPSKPVAPTKVMQIQERLIDAVKQQSCQRIDRMIAQLSPTAEGEGR